MTSENVFFICAGNEGDMDAGNYKLFEFVYIAHNKYTIMTKYLVILLYYMYKLRDYVNTPMQSFDVIFTAM